MVSQIARLNPALASFWRTQADIKVLHGGRSSSKTWDAAGFLIYLTQQYRLRVMCTRQFQNRIDDSVYNVLELQAERFGVHKQFDFQQSSIVHKRTKSEFLFYGRARNINEIKGTNDVDIHWAEECELLTEDEWKVIDPTLRVEHSFHLMVFNPKFVSDFVYQRFVVNPPPGTLVRQINYPENPFLSQTMLRKIEAAKAEDQDAFEHIYLGVPLTDDARVIIKLSWIEAAVDAHIKLGFEPAGRKVVGFDVADDGEDLNANIYAHGCLVEWGEEWKGAEDELLKSAMRTYDNAVARGARIRYDSIGVGASAGAKFDELNATRVVKVRYSKFNAGGAVHKPDAYYVRDRMDKVLNKDHFSNIKAQTWWGVADRFRNTYDAVRNGTVYPQDELICISSNFPKLEKLKSELSTPRRDFDKNGRVKVESKDDLKKPNRVGGPQKSPNLADAFVMCFAPDDATALNISDDALKTFGVK